MAQPKMMPEILQAAGKKCSFIDIDDETDPN